MYGVSLGSYWFGFLSFIAVLVILFFTYFVLKGGIRANLSEDDYLDTSYEIPGGRKVASKTMSATQSRTAFVGMLGLIFSEIFFSITFFIGVFLDFDQNMVAMSLAMAFIIWGFILDLYRREFLPYVLIKKNRKEKMIPEREFKYKKRRLAR
jgi:hypothetical protein